jgi:hypothetical protein
MPLITDILPQTAMLVAPLTKVLRYWPQYLFVTGLAVWGSFYKTFFLFNVSLNGQARVFCRV